GSGYKQAAAQGQSFFAASGDSGAYDCANSPSGGSIRTVDQPASDPYMTGVGGTTLNLDVNGAYASETVWSNPSHAPPLGGGGGVSQVFGRPAWQTGPGVFSQYSNGHRQVPDVALDADPRTGYSVYITNNNTTGWAAAAAFNLARDLVTTPLRLSSGSSGRATRRIPPPPLPHSTGASTLR